MFSSVSLVAVSIRRTASRRVCRIALLIDSPCSSEKRKSASRRETLSSLAARPVHGGLEAVAVHFGDERLASQSTPGVTGEIRYESIRPVEPLRKEVPRRLTSDLFAVARD